MIEITRGNPTSDEIAALVVALALTGRAAPPRSTSAPADRWRASSATVDFRPLVLAARRPDERWRQARSLSREELVS